MDLWRAYTAEPVRPNKLVFDNHMLRNIRLHAPQDIGLESPPRSFDYRHDWRRWNAPEFNTWLDTLHSFDAFRSGTLCLNLTWYRWWGNPYLHWYHYARGRSLFDVPGVCGSQFEPTEEPIYTILDDDWAGRFRKITITLENLTRTSDPLDKLLRLAEAYAAKLVGVEDALGAFIWGEEIETIRMRTVRADSNVKFVT